MKTAILTADLSIIYSIKPECNTHSASILTADEAEEEEEDQRT